jgi:hypothetical protein
MKTIILISILISSVGFSRTFNINHRINQRKHIIFEERKQIVSACYCQYTIADAQPPRLSGKPLKGYWLIKYDENGQTFIDNFGTSFESRERCNWLAKFHSFCVRSL